MATQSSRQHTYQDVMNTTFSDSLQHSGTPFSTNDDTLAVTRFVVQKILVPIITSIGLCGNIVSIRVLTHRTMLSSTNCYLTALAIFDVLYLVFSFTLSLNHYEKIKEELFYKHWFPFGRVLTDICSNVSVCLTVTFSLERLVAVSYPMKGRLLCTPKRARMIISVVIVFAIVCTAPEFFETQVVTVEKDNRTTVHLELSEMAKTDAYQIGYYNFFVFTFTILPLILLSTFNGMLVKTVFAAMKIRKRMVYSAMRQSKSRRQTEQNRITMMLISVVIVFLICQFPYAILLLYGMYIETQSIQLSPNGYNNMKIAGNIVNLLVLINASINFVLYSVMSTKFRKVCFRLFCLFPRHRRAFLSETSSFNGHWIQGSNLPVRFRSQHRYQRTVHTGTPTSGRRICRGVHLKDHSYNKRLKPSPSATNGHSSSVESSNESSEVFTLADDTTTPFVTRKMPKLLSKGSPSAMTLRQIHGVDRMAEDTDDCIQGEKRHIFQTKVLRIQMIVKQTPTSLSNRSLMNSSV